jgi:hypothetical protein
MGGKGKERGTPGSSQNQKAPQDETPGSRPEKTSKDHDIGVVKRKPKPGEGLER